MSAGIALSSCGHQGAARLPQQAGRLDVLTGLGASGSLCPGAAYTCLEAATGRALLRKHMDIAGEENPLNRLRVVIEPGAEALPDTPTRPSAGVRRELTWGQMEPPDGAQPSRLTARGRSVRSVHPR